MMKSCNATEREREREREGGVRDRETHRKRERAIVYDNFFLTSIHAPSF